MPKKKVEAKIEQTKLPVRSSQATDIEEFCALWMPFEVEILRLAAGGEADEELRNADTSDPQSRRYLLERLFEDREQGAESAKKAMAAFSQILQQILAKTQKIIENDEHGEIAPGTIALQQLTDDPTFLRKANAYSVAFQNWLIDFVQRNPEPLDIPVTSRTGGETKDAVLKSRTYPVQSSQEWTAVMQAFADSKYGRYLTTNEQAGTLRHYRPGAPYFTEAKLLDSEREAGYGIELLKAATQQLDIDAGYIVLYISRLLAPPGQLQPNTAAVGWVDLDDVARMTLGGYAPGPRELAERREKVWNAIRFGARWFVVGNRSIPYVDKQTGKEIDTELHTSLWQVMSRQEPVQPALFPSDTAPLRVELVVSREWTELTTRSDTAQFLAFGEVLGSIPGGQASGAWARALGMAYMVWARTKMADALSGKATLTRRQLLEQFPPKTAPYESFLGTTNAKRIYEYWNAAEEMLKERELIQCPKERQPKPSGAKAWQEWLDSPPSWTPGRLLREALEQQARKLYTAKPRQLNPAKRRGRPPKKS